MRGVVVVPSSGCCSHPHITIASLHPIPTLWAVAHSKGLGCCRVWLLLLHLCPTPQVVAHEAGGWQCHLGLQTASPGFWGVGDSWCIPLGAGVVFYLSQRVWGVSGDVACLNTLGCTPSGCPAPWASWHLPGAILSPFEPLTSHLSKEEGQCTVGRLSLHVQ